jgi:hypothetical protein
MRNNKAILILVLLSVAMTTILVKLLEYPNNDDFTSKVLFAGTLLVVLVFLLGSVMETGNIGYNSDILKVNYIYFMIGYFELSHKCYVVILAKKDAISSEAPKKYISVTLKDKEFSIPDSIKKNKDVYWNGKALLSCS